MNVTQITQDALLLCLKECEEQSHGVNHWIDYVLESTSRSLPLMRRKAQTAARDFTALEHSLSQAYDLQETWEKVNTISRKEMEQLPLNAPTYNLSPNRLATLITGWEKNLSNAKSCFHGYRKQDAISAAELNLQFLRKLPGSLNASFQEVLEITHNELVQERIAENHGEVSFKRLIEILKPKSPLPEIPKSTLPKMSKSPKPEIQESPIPTYRVKLSPLKIHEFPPSSMTEVKMLPVSSTPSDSSNDSGDAATSTEVSGDDEDDDEDDCPDKDDDTTGSPDLGEANLSTPDKEDATNTHKVGNNSTGTDNDDDNSTNNPKSAGEGNPGQHVQVDAYPSSPEEGDQEEARPVISDDNTGQHVLVDNINERSSGDGEENTRPPDVHNTAGTYSISENLARTLARMRKRISADIMEDRIHAKKLAVLQNLDSQQCLDSTGKLTSLRFNLAPHSIPTRLKSTPNVQHNNQFET